MSGEVNFFLRLRSSTQTVSSASTTAHYLPQTSTCNMEEHLQYGPCLKRCETISHCFLAFSFLMIFVGGAMVATGPFYENSQLRYAGIGVIVTGNLVLILSITSSCYVQHKGSWHPSRATTDATSYNANASNTAFTLEVQPPTSHGPGRLPTFEYSYQQQVQTGTNQYTPALPAVILYTPEQTAVNHFPVAQFALNQYTPAQLALNQLPPAQTAINQLPPAQTTINRYPSAHADNSPPSYNEVMEDLR